MKKEKINWAGLINVMALTFLFSFTFFHAWSGDKESKAFKKDSILKNTRIDSLRCVLIDFKQSACKHDFSITKVSYVTFTNGDCTYLDWPYYKRECSKCQKDEVISECEYYKIIANNKQKEANEAKSLARDVCARKTVQISDSDVFVNN